MVRPHLSDRMMNYTIPRERARGLEDRLGTDGLEITFSHDGEAIGPMLVVIEWANRQPGQSGGTTSIVTTEGEVRGRTGELDQVQAGDLFAIDGQTAEIVEAVVTDRGIVRAPFRLMAGGRS